MNGLPPPGFNDRHLTILKLTAKGYDQYRIAKEMGYAYTTIKRYRADMLKLLNVTSSAQAVALGYENGWLQDENKKAA